jgi:hypothetical protein
MKNSNLLPFRATPREKRTKKQKGKVVTFPVKPKREVQVLPVILEGEDARYRIGQLRDDKLNEICAFLRTMNNAPLEHAKDGTPYTGQLIFRYHGKDFLIHGYPSDKIADLRNLVDSLKTNAS